MRKHYIALTIAVLALLGALYQFRGTFRDSYGRWQRGPVPPAVSRTDILNQTGTSPNESTTVPEPTPASTPTPTPKPPTNTNAPVPPPKPVTGSPTSFNLSVLFIPQAPMKIWDAYHEDYCEEASMLMLQAYQDDVTKMSIDEMEKRLKAIADFETKAYGEGAWKSTDAERTAEIMRNFLKLSALAVKITSIADVKAEIAKGHPVMLPADGRLLKNPNFKNGGPVYHMLVAKGYTSTTIVTNDPGTRLGEDYVYSNDVLWNAIHDWNDGDVPHGAKMMIVLQ